MERLFKFLADVSRRPAHCVTKIQARLISLGDHTKVRVFAQISL